jgi:hypothetical protein
MKKLNLHNNKESSSPAWSHVPVNPFIKPTPKPVKHVDSGITVHPNKYDFFTDSSEEDDEEEDEDDICETDVSADKKTQFVLKVIEQIAVQQQQQNMHTNDTQVKDLKAALFAMIKQMPE